MLVLRPQSWAGQFLSALREEAGVATNWVEPFMVTRGSCGAPGGDY